MEIEQVPAYKRWSNRYSHAFKMEVIEAFQSGQMSQRQITRKNGIHRTTIVAWEKKYGNLEKNFLRMEEKRYNRSLLSFGQPSKLPTKRTRPLSM